MKSSIYIIDVLLLYYQNKQVDRKYGHDQNKISTKILQINKLRKSLHVVKHQKKISIQEMKMNVEDKSRSQNDEYLLDGASNSVALFPPAAPRSLKLFLLWITSLWTAEIKADKVNLLI